jgi:hypothetical protein
MRDIAAQCIARTNAARPSSSFFVVSFFVLSSSSPVPQQTLPPCSRLRKPFRQPDVVALQPRGQQHPLAVRVHRKTLDGVGLVELKGHRATTLAGGDIERVDGSPILAEQIQHAAAVAKLHRVVRARREVA